VEERRFARLLHERQVESALAVGRIDARGDPPVGVLPAHRRQSIATALMEAGHVWADDRGLPVALDTDTEVNVAFSTRRGYMVMARERVPDSDRELVAMRRRPPAVARAWMGERNAPSCPLSHSVARYGVSEGPRGRPW
jgi:GNAT superfamily N-acetyltransferase